MNKIASLRQKRGQVKSLRDAAIDTAINETRGLTVDEQKQVDDLENEIKGLDNLIALAVKSEAESVEAAKTIAARVEVDATGSKEVKREKGDAVSRIIRSVAHAKGQGTGLRGAAEFCESVLHDGEVAKALAAGTGSSGGFLVPENYSAELIEYLRPLSVVRKMGARTVPLVNGNMSLPKITGGSSAAYLGENTNIATTQQSFGLVRLSAKKLAALTPISNDLIRFSSPQADAFVRTDLVTSIAQAEDQNFLRNDGTGAGPKGLRYWAPSANRMTVNATVNLVNVTADSSRLMLALMNANVGMTNAGWIMAPRTKMYLGDIRDGNGNKAFPEIDNNQFRGFPIGVTTNVPINLAVTGTSESELYFVDFADVVIGEVPGMEIDVSNTAAYHDGSGVVAAFSQDQTVIRVIMHNDMVVRHTESVAVFTDVDWGA